MALPSHPSDSPEPPASRPSERTDPAESDPAGEAEPAATPPGEDGEDRVEARARPLLDRLEALGLPVSMHRHAAAHTVEESRALRGVIPGAHTKNLFVKDKKGRLFLIVCEEDRAVDLKGLHRLIGGTGRVSFADAGAMQRHLGVSPGSATVFGLMHDATRAVTLVLDAALLAAETINAHPLTNEATLSIARSDLLTFLAATGHRPLVVDLAARPADEADGADR